MLISYLNGVKHRLQFTGWLQYIPTALLALGFTLLAALARFLDHPSAAVLFLWVGTLLLAALIFDLITVKLRLRPPERLPKRKDGLGMFDLMRSRRSCRSFQTRKLTSADYTELMEIVRIHLAEPTIGKSPIRFEYVSAPLTVWPVVNATEFLVAIAPSEYNRLAVIDVGRSLEKIVIDATRMGLATCWIGPGAEQSSIARCLGERFDPQRDHIICVCAVGYKSRFWPLFLRIVQVQFHRRLPLSSLFFADSQFKQPLNVGAAPFNRFGRSYEGCQWSPSSYNGQTTRCVAVMALESLKKPLAFRGPRKRMRTRTGEEKRGSDPSRKISVHPRSSASGSNKGEIEESEPCLARFDFYAATESRYYAAVAVGIWCANWELGCEALGIPGHFAVLPPGERGDEDEMARPRLPRYDVSWVLDRG